MLEAEAESLRASGREEDTEDAREDQAQEEGFGRKVEGVLSDAASMARVPHFNHGQAKSQRRLNQKEGGKRRGFDCKYCIAGSISKAF
eukprot:3448048-Rhodomonas_salina.1